MKGFAARRRLLGAGVLALAAFLGAWSALLGVCGPFTDVAGDTFCPFVLEIFYMGITTGLTPTTYDPTSGVTRLQMAAFLSRTVDGVSSRAGRRAALRRFWTPGNEANLGVTTVSSAPVNVESDGADIWAAGSNTVSRVRASDGKLLETWTAAFAHTVLTAIGKVFVTAASAPGQLYRIDPSQPAGLATTLATNLGDLPFGIAYDGSRIWTANWGIGGAGTGSVSIATVGATVPWTVTTVTTGFSQPRGALWDGTSIWVTDQNAGKLLRLSPAGAILQTVTVGTGPGQPVFNGANLWVPNGTSDTVSVVRASTGALLKTLTGNGMDGPFVAAFDGQRVLVTDINADSVSLWKAADLSEIGSLSTGAGSDPFGACSDGISFWIALTGKQTVARF
jgi:hypothetical protein